MQEHNALIAQDHLSQSHGQPIMLRGLIISLNSVPAYYYLSLKILHTHLHAMVRYSIKIVQSAVNFIYPDQIPVLACDQPLFAIAKEIQWAWPENLGENHFVVMLGRLHIEITAFKTLGSWLNGSVWVDALTRSMVATAGTADSYLHCSHLTRTRYAHQVTSVALYML